MFKKLLSLEKKQFFRSANFQKSLFIKIFMGIGVFFMLLYAFGIGIGLYFGLKEIFPDKDPFILVNNFILFYFIVELLMRYAIQKMPIVHIKPLLILPIKKKTVVNYGLAKSFFSVFTFIPIFILLPFTVVLILKGHSTLNSIVWLFSIYFISISIHFLNFLINKSNTYFYTVLSILTSLIALEYFHIFKISVYAGKIFNYLANHPYLIIVPIIMVILSYKLSFKFMYKNINLDSFDTNKKEINTTDLSWLNRFGKVAPFLKNDIKLIWRNKRPRQTLFSAIIFLFYALYFLAMEDKMKNSAFLAFAMMFVTGGFAMTFGQFVPSWDSEYYQLLMSQNIKYKTYLESKWYLMGFAVIISFILATPYIYFGWKVYALLIAGAFFNLGINSYLVLFGGLLNRTPLKLNEKAKAFGNTQGFSMTNFIIAVPKIILPMLLFAIPNAIWGFNAGILTIVILSSIGIMLKGYFLKKIENLYQKYKYKTVAAYKQNG